jgi:hypothetical protein
MASCLVFAPVLSTACSSGPSSSAEENTARGTVSLPLQTVAGGHTYRLAGEVDIYGPQYATLYSDISTDETVLSTTLQTGDYTAYLSAWTLLRDDGTGNFVPVQAFLVNYYVSFSIYNGTTTSISFQFETDGVIVTVGQGTLNVDIQVTESTPLCTAFGTDCPDGTWCAPPELTGNPIACIFAGSAAIGDPCRSPADCPAYSSCFDLGQGPVCAALCEPADFGSSCPSSPGTCTAAGRSYGICTTDGSVPSGGGQGGAEGGAGGGPN